MNFPFTVQWPLASKTHLKDLCAKAKFVFFFYTPTYSAPYLHLRHINSPHKQEMASLLTRCQCHFTQLNLQLCNTGHIHYFRYTYKLLYIPSISRRKKKRYIHLCHSTAANEFKYQCQYIKN